MRVRGELVGEDVRDTAESAIAFAAAAFAAAVYSAAAVRDAAESAAKISSTAATKSSESERVIKKSSCRLFLKKSDGKCECSYDSPCGTYTNGGIGEWDVSKVTDMRELFKDKI